MTINKVIPMKYLAYVTGLLTFILAGCANQPTPQWYPDSPQKQVNAAQHWGLIAADAVEQTRQIVNAQSFARDRPLYVTENSATQFDSAFRNYMISALVKAGMPVSTVREGAIEITYETQVIRHGASFDPRQLGYKPGMATAGAAAFWVLREATSTALVAGTVAGAAGYDVYKARESTGVELLLTTSIVHANHYIMHNTDSYYIEKADAYLFEPCRSKSARGCRPKPVY
ncbi:hypothetical protein MTYP_00418 [Methylophilaceae bacterium]|nr:hypothetical protein MTYP_00418 [Methylophilaceae bacterium]